MTVDPTTAQRHEFLLEQYKILSGLNERNQTYRWQAMQVYMVGIGAFYSTVLGGKLNATLAQGWIFAVPLIFSVVGLQLGRSMHGALVERGKVMSRIEGEYAAPGWTSERDDRNDSWQPCNRIMQNSLIFWSLQVLLNLAVLLLTLRGVIFSDKAG